MTRGMATAAALVLCACGHRTSGPAELQPKAFGVAVVPVSGEKQTGGVGVLLEQPLVVQVNDAQGAAVAGALVHFAGSGGATATPAQGLTGSDGQFSVGVTPGSVSGHYQIVVSTGKSAAIRVDEVALGYQEMLGARLNELHCARCHDAESTAERVSNYDNLNTKPHPFSDGKVLNSLSDPDLTAIISHGGAALNKSAEMPPYGNRLTRSGIAALVAFIRAVADTPISVPAQPARDVRR